MNIFVFENKYIFINCLLNVITIFEMQNFFIGGLTEI